MIARAAGTLGIVAFLVVCSCSSEPPKERVQFAEYDYRALVLAQEAGKPTLVYVTAAFEKACQEQNRGALMNPEVIAAFAPFIRQKRDVTKTHPSELALIGIGELPIFTFTDHEGETVARLVGLQTPEKLIAAAKKASPTSVR